MDRDLFETLDRIDQLQKVLAPAGFGDDLGGEQVGEMTGIVGPLDHVQNLGRDLFPGVVVAAGELLDVQDQRAGIGGVVLRFAQLIGGDGEVGPHRIELTYSDSCDPFEDDLDGVARLSFDRDQLDERANRKEIIRRRVFSIGIAMRRNHQATVPRQGFLDCLNRPRSTD